MYSRKNFVLGNMFILKQQDAFWQEGQVKKRKRKKLGELRKKRSGIKKQGAKKKLRQKKDKQKNIEGMRTGWIDTLQLPPCLYKTGFMCPQTNSQEFAVTSLAGCILCLRSYASRNQAKLPPPENSRSVDCFNSSCQGSSDGKQSILWSSGENHEMHLRNETWN